MTFHSPITPRAAEARLAQLNRGGFTEWDFPALIDGETVSMNAFLEVQSDPVGDDEYEPNGEYLVMGGWTELADGSLWAGNRAELEALVGKDTVRGWEVWAEECMA